jgi:hypothetical protein
VTAVVIGAVLCAMVSCEVPVAATLIVTPVKAPLTLLEALVTAMPSIVNWALLASLVPGVLSVVASALKPLLLSLLALMLKALATPVLLELNTN